jgi:hypothetical protein
MISYYRPVVQSLIHDGLNYRVVQAAKHDSGREVVIPMRQRLTIGCQHTHVRIEHDAIRIKRQSAVCSLLGCPARSDCHGDSQEAAARAFGRPPLAFFCSWSVATRSRRSRTHSPERVWRATRPQKGKVPGGTASSGSGGSSGRFRV